RFADCLRLRLGNRLRLRDRLRKRLRFGLRNRFGFGYCFFYRLFNRFSADFIGRRFVWRSIDNVFRKFHKMNFYGFWKLNVNFSWRYRNNRCQYGRVQTDSDGRAYKAHWELTGLGMREQTRHDATWAWR